MSESRFTTPSTPNKSTRARKRPSKGKAAAAQPLEAPQTGAGALESSVPIRLSAIDRESMIQTAAYFRAQRRNFESGHELEDWLAAESEIDAVLLEDRAQS